MGVRASQQDDGHIKLSFDRYSPRFPGFDLAWPGVSRSRLGSAQFGVRALLRPGVEGQVKAGVGSWVRPGSGVPLWELGVGECLSGGSSPLDLGIVGAGFWGPGGWDR